jgi:serine-type D-Ala-D-Ala carboxypeptidase (penicillin-binding protein 5/6)
MLEGGTIRRRRGRVTAVVGALFALGAAAAAWLVLSGAVSDRNATLDRAAEAADEDEPQVVGPADVGLSEPDAFSLRFKQPPRAGLVFDLENGRVLWRHKPEKRVAMASLTKVMTALLVVERTDSDERVRITDDALDYRGQGVGVLKRGKKVPVESLLNGMLIMSGNDFAIALADHVAGSRGNFVRLMNRRARELDFDCTRFASPEGLEPGNRSCAADLAGLARVAMSKVRIARVVARRDAKVRVPGQRRRAELFTTNPLLRSGYPGTIGLKTGYTDEAGQCLVAVVRRGRHTLGVVLLDAPNPADQAAKLLERAFRRAG